MKLRLFERFDNAERHTAAVSFQHDTLTFGLIEPEDFHERFYHMVHSVVVVVMKQDPVQRDMRGRVFHGDLRFGG